MKTAKRKALARKGWRVGTAKEFLGLSDEEAALIELKLALSSMLRDLRERNRCTQVQFATTIGSSQSRVAKMEAGDPSVSIDLLIKSLLALGATTKDIGRAIETSRREAA